MGPTRLSTYVSAPNNVKNTTISADAEPLYTITTDLVADTHTHVGAPQAGHRIATITWRNIFPDTVTFSDG